MPWSRLVLNLWLVILIGLFVVSAEATEVTFRAHTSNTKEGPFLRTGDLGFLADGQLFITGRLKDFVIVRGANIYLQDIDWIAGRAHPALRLGGGTAQIISLSATVVSASSAGSISARVSTSLRPCA